MRFGMIGSGSWATALAKILTDNGNTIHWWIRNTSTIATLKKRRHNPHYLGAAFFDTDKLVLSSNIEEVIKQSDLLVIAVPSAYIIEALSALPTNILIGKKIISAIKGILPNNNQLLNQYLSENFNVSLTDYFTVLGPCHAEEVAAEKLSYLTFSGIDEGFAAQIAACFTTEYINTKVNHDILGVQYAAVLKNIYALGAGIAHGLDYGDNFLSVYIANCAHEMVGFCKKMVWDKESEEEQKSINYSASVYLGDLLVTCYSLYSRNRTFGNMIGKGYSVTAAQLELKMIAEGYNACKCIYKTNETVQAEIPIATAIYQILWENLCPEEGFKQIESSLV